MASTNISKLDCKVDLLALHVFIVSWFHVPYYRVESVLQSSQRDRNLSDSPVSSSGHKAWCQTVKTHGEIEVS